MFVKLEDLHTDLIGILINFILTNKKFLENNCDVRKFINIYKNQEGIKNEKLFDLGLYYILFFRINNNSTKSESELYIGRRDFALKICNYVVQNKEKITDNIFEMYNCVDIDMVNLIKNAENYNFDLTYEEFIELCDDIGKKYNPWYKSNVDENNMDKNNMDENYKKIYDKLKNIKSDDIRLCIKDTLLILFNTAFNLKRKLKLNTEEDDIIHNNIQFMCFEDKEYLKITSKSRKLMYSYSYEDYLKYISYVKENLDNNVFIQKEIIETVIDEIDEDFGDSEEEKEDQYESCIFYMISQEYRKNKKLKEDTLNKILNNNLGKTSDTKFSKTLYDKYNIYFSHIISLCKNKNDKMFLYDDNILKCVKAIDSI